jgi:hypothetical protein
LAPAETISSERASWSADPGDNHSLFGSRNYPFAPSAFFLRFFRLRRDSDCSSAVSFGDW